jgi:spore maturation protein SpmB
MANGTIKKVSFSALVSFVLGIPSTLVPLGIIYLASSGGWVIFVFVPVAGVFGSILGLLAIMFGAIGYRDTRKNKYSGTWFSVTGIISAITGFFLWAFLLL